jgi:hypothetical protein
VNAGNGWLGISIVVWAFEGYLTAARSLIKMANFELVETEAFEATCGKSTKRYMY